MLLIWGIHDLSLSFAEENELIFSVLQNMMLEKEGELLDNTEDEMLDILSMVSF
jgi:hypothetical protein